MDFDILMYMIHTDLFNNDTSSDLIKNVSDKLPSYKKRLKCSVYYYPDHDCRKFTFDYIMF